MHLEIALGSDIDFLRVTSGLLCSLQPLAAQHNVSLKELGDLDTLLDRICAEIAAANTVVVWCRCLGLVTQAGRQPGISRIAKWNHVSSARLRCRSCC
jgi:hypothetical protein